MARLPVSSPIGDKKARIMKVEVYESIQQGGNAIADISSYLGLVRKIAIYLRPRVPNYIETDDMIQLGTLGLIEAEKKFDASQGVGFEDFAKTRIKGAILDEARRLSYQSRLAVKNLQRHNKARDELANKFGRDPNNREIADHLDIDIAELERQRTHANSFDMLAIDGMTEDSTLELPDVDSSVIDKVNDEEIKELLTSAISQLDERRQLILSLYYVEEMNLKEIGATIGVNESRVSQLLSSCVKKLREIMQHQQKDFLQP
jgi:RNA polymerase sigma factor for flagellar operon FliA